MNRRQPRSRHGYASTPPTIPGLEPARRSGRSGGPARATGSAPETSGDVLAGLLPESGLLFFPFR